MCRYLCVHRVLFCASFNYVYAFYVQTIIHYTLYAHYLYAYSSIQILTHFLFCLYVCTRFFSNNKKKTSDHNYVSVRCECVGVCMCVHLALLILGLFSLLLLLLACVVGFLFAAWHTLLAHFLRRELFFLRRNLNNNLCINVCTLEVCTNMTTVYTHALECFSTIQRYFRLSWKEGPRIIELLESSSLDAAFLCSRLVIAQMLTCDVQQK